ncbi:MULTISPECIES: TetR/AcrR family transcriptional regulator [Marinobacter]|jgi:AcrR family transcriptional regulator|uniref:TetR family transcriptional regulator n=1 Tax=Marinobacter salsuginis TaxID=418719 RepID=A0A5M3Q198_9GAMM|nr:MULTISPECIES: TetR/AcrR family transcriptional regulator [Marinobacter]MBO6809610.1 TetR/AcrR family transcriptional regulator [Marinobacter sp.]MBO6872555.1 TetR/AcrR family transcriptional regulator [Marinobacter sp.]MBY6071712.1 TetR/AcrR family transcriptional regulator [Marinobacter salsuginis]GBO84067.1 TetR family transcriptional regulator [Marinobacter salsuginis]GBO88882.1 TetR family transcriptional regulator [Marinobacter salsuginis]|tara:strand:- start:10 stop:642 length:633 start_codon:yes stop_codon:yes gene_type:complete
MAYRETEKMRQRKAEARKRIVECTYQCVAEGGFRSARITRIAGLAGVATGTIYRHFESREDLFAEIFRLATQREVDKVAEALGSPGNAAERLERALRQFAERALKGPQMAWSLIAEPVDPKVEEERLAYRKAYANLFEKAIREGIEEGCIPDQDALQSSTCLVGAIAESLVGPLSPTQTSQANSAKEDNNDPLVNSIIRFCMQGLTGTRR